MTTNIPLWVCEVFPKYFTSGKVPKRGHRKKRTFSNLGGNNKTTMPDNVAHDTNPATLVKFVADQGFLSANWLRPLKLVSPAMVTAFPRLKEETDAEGNLRAAELDLTMKGAGEAQETFRLFMDRLDDQLLDFMYANQNLLGKKGLTREQVQMSQRRLFKTRISTKTGRQYPDAMVVRYKNKETPLSVVDKDLTVLDINDPGVIGFNSIVRAVVQFSGSYCRGGAYGNSFELVCVQVLGSCAVTSATDFQAASEAFSGIPADEATWPTLN